MAFFTANEFNYFDAIDFRLKVKRLSQLARGDYSCLPRILEEHFPQTDVPIRTVPFVERYVSETSGVYVRPAQRAFGAALPSDAWAKLQRVYRSSQVDHHMDSLERMAWVQQSAWLLVLPGARMGAVQLRVLDASELEPEVQNWQDAANPDAWSRVVVRVPVGGNANQVVYGEMHLTPYEAYIIQGGQKVPVFGDSTHNPLGRIPLIALHTVDPEAGRWHAPAHDSLLNLAIALCVQESDTETLVHYQSWGQWVISGADIADLMGSSGKDEPKVPAVSMGVGKVFMLPVSSNPDAAPAKLEIVQGQPPIAQITSWQESRLRLFCSLKGLSADAFLRTNTAVTASARRVSEHDRKVIRDRIRPALLRAEQTLAEMIASILNVYEIVPIDPALVDVQVTFQDPPAIVDPLHDAQATEARARIGVESPVDVIAAEQGLGFAEARKVWERNMKDAEMIKGSEKAGETV